MPNPCASLRARISDCDMVAVASAYASGGQFFYPTLAEALAASLQPQPCPLSGQSFHSSNLNHVQSLNLTLSLTLTPSPHAYTFTPGLPFFDMVAMDASLETDVNTILARMARFDPEEKKLLYVKAKQLHPNPNPSSIPGSTLNKLF